MAELITNKLLQSLVADAQQSTRRRMNYNFHINLSDLCQRLLIGIEPGSYIRPHRHRDKDETMLVVSGKIGIVFFNPDGSIQNKAILAQGTENIGANISANTFHSFVSLEPGTVFFESKEGPYQTLLPEEWGQWAPAESDGQAKEYYEQLARLFF